MKKVRLFVYDFDGTLVDSKLDIADSVNCALRELGFRELPRETIFGYIGDGVEALMSRALSGVTPAGPTPASVPLDPTPPPACAEAETGFRRSRSAIAAWPPGVCLDSGPLAGVGPAVEAFKRHYGVRYLDQTRFYPHCRETIDSFSDKKHAIFSN
ncbi:MAG: HAD hydrolase-like protein, partial [Nitrospinae bacterium]|nr:HAD hydrolase-like protein [Nitrospinota bacterium]